jgi:hypothetical protein
VCYDRAVAGKKRQASATTEGHEIYDPEVLYPFWKLAGGNMSEAIRLAAEAKETRTPTRVQTWSEYADRHAFRERFRKEERARWAAFHAEREEKQQDVLDTIAFTFEKMSDAFSRRVIADFETLEDLSKPRVVRRQAEKRLMGLFGTMKGVNTFYRMYLRSRGQPETITKMEHDGQIATTYRDLDEAPKANSPEEARRVAESIERNEK